MSGEIRLRESFRYDVALSFAGEDRPVVERLARLMRRNGIRVFYDAWEQADLWGKDLFQHLDAIYRSAARYCLIFVSKHYLNKAWTKHEIKSAQARAFNEDSEYILPIRLDDSELPGLAPTIAYLDTRTVPLKDICQIFVLKLGLKREIDISTLLSSEDENDRSGALDQIAIRSYSEYFERVIDLMLSDPINGVREKAAWVLDNLNDLRSLPALIKAIHDPIFGVRSAAGWAIVHLGEELVRLEMERIRSDSDNVGAQEMAHMILQNL
ncbi:MAG: TIR domain-containing protein [Candidatus Electrothrix sp. LOE2]|nr:TIR domain-containing protein [Candidatus Electrothrix sp. LOE2]